jgi:superfamily II DNA or RNA helicase
MPDTANESALLDWASLTPGVLLSGVEAGTLVEVIAVSPLPGSASFNVVYRRRDGQTGIFVADASTAGIAITSPESRWSFDADAAAFRLTIEAHRIRLAYLFDPMLAVHTSLVEPLPHQITAVYGELLPRRPLRFLLADDPGAGKTIMTGLFIRELMARGDLQRCLIIAPGSLVEQWQDELETKFHLRFDILTTDQLEAAGGARWFEDHPLAIARLDKLSRDETLQERLRHVTPWDLIVVDEAHKMAATVFGDEVKRTKRYELGMNVSHLTRHFLLLSATPHNGKEPDFQLFMALLDPDRFEGRYRPDRQRIDRTELHDVMRRLVKENLLRFDGRRLFPERRAQTVAFELSPLERQLYDEVSAYVREQFNRADTLDGRRRGNVGFALTILQRRLASSSAAIAASLTRRRMNLERRLAEGTAAATPDIGDQDDIDDLPSDEREELVEQVVDESTAARTAAELQAEIDILRGLEALAARVRRDPESDGKWRELAILLGGDLLTRSDDMHRRKMVIFTEHRDTLNDLVERIRSLRGRHEAVVTIHGGMHREARKAAEEAFRNDPTVEVLVATDAAGEGINLQRAHLMANYDLPWNPNRIEQRFGRIHRIGQTEVCHLWNFIANGTREGDVFARLFTKIDEQRAMLGDGIFDILGEFFRDTPLRDLLLEAVRYNQSDGVRERFAERIDNLLDVTRARELMEERALAADSMDLRQVQEVQAEMERADARRLQPHFIKGFFVDAFRRLGGTLRPVEGTRLEIRNVPTLVRNRARAIASVELPRRYERIAFEKTDVAGPPLAQFVCPGHPLLDATVDLTIANDEKSVRAGSVLIDPNDHGREPRLLFVYEAAVQDARPKRGGGNEVVWRDLCFVERTEHGMLRAAGFAPHLDYRPPTLDERPLLDPMIATAVFGGDAEAEARAFALTDVLPERRRHLEDATNTRIDRTLRQVRERLIGEITWHEQRAVALDDAARRGREVRQSAEQQRQWADTLRARLDQRQDDLANQRRLSMLPPQLVGAALIVPIGYFGPKTATIDLAARAEVERIAMQAIMDTERRLGFVPRDVSSENLGYDIESAIPGSGRLRFLEVKGRSADATHVTVTKNELLAALNKPDDFILALVLVSPNEAPVIRYRRALVTRDPEFATTSVNFDIAQLLAQASEPA